MASRRPLQFFASVLSPSVASLLVRAYSCAARFLSNTHTHKKRETTRILVRFPARCFCPFPPENLQLIFISFVSYSSTLHVLTVVCTFTAALAAHSNSLHLSLQLQPQLSDFNQSHSGSSSSAPRQKEFEQEVATGRSNKRKRRSEGAGSQRDCGQVRTGHRGDGVVKAVSLAATTVKENQKTIPPSLIRVSDRRS